MGGFVLEVKGFAFCFFSGLNFQNLFLSRERVCRSPAASVSLFPLCPETNQVQPSSFFGWITLFFLVVEEWTFFSSRLLSWK